MKAPSHHSPVALQSSMSLQSQRAAKLEIVSMALQWLESQYPLPRTNGRTELRTCGQSARCLWHFASWSCSLAMAWSLDTEVATKSKFVCLDLMSAASKHSLSYLRSVHCSIVIPILLASSLALQESAVKVLTELEVLPRPGPGGDAGNTCRHHFSPYF